MVILQKKNGGSQTTPLYASLLMRVCSRSCFVDENNPNGRPHRPMLSDRILSSLSSAKSILFSGAPIIVGLRAVRDPLNTLLRDAAQRMQLIRGNGWFEQRNPLDYYETRLANQGMLFGCICVSCILNNRTEVI